MTPEELKLAKLAAICKNPVLWAKAFLQTVDNATKKIEPWSARWYQAEMLLDSSDKKVARCGRRTGGKRYCPFSTNCWNTYIVRESAATCQTVSRETTNGRRTETRCEASPLEHVHFGKEYF